MSAEYAYTRRPPLPPPPPPPAGGAVVSATRRRYEAQPPTALATAVGMSARFGSHPAGPSPSPASSTLSSPFIGYGSAPITASPVSTSTHVSPITSAGTSGSYDPSTWASGANAQRSGYAVVPANGRPAGYGDSTATHSPPPPYSPQFPSTSREGVSPVDQINTTPSSAVLRPPAPISRVSAEHIRDARLSSMSTSSTELDQAPSFPPPPMTASNRRSRSSSRPANERPHGMFSLSALSSRVRSSSQVPTVQRPDGAPNPEPMAHPSPAQVSRRALTVHASSSTNDHSMSQARAVPPSLPPGSRRSASTGAIGAANTVARVRTERASPTGSAWAPGMPLPPPPPGPPPSSRSQSLNRSMGLSPGEEPGPRPGTGMATRRPPTTRSALPPVPPTPAGWMDHEEPSSTTSAIGRSPLGRDEMAINDAIGGSSNATGQDQAVKGIRERRSESRTRKGMAVQETSSPSSERSNNPWADEMNQPEPVVPANLNLSTPSPGLSRRPAVSKASPRSPRGPPSLEGRFRSTTSSSTSGSTRPTSEMLTNSRAETGSEGRYSGSLIGTPPPWATSAPEDRLDHARPVSHLLHMPNAKGAMPAPLTPSRPNFGPTMDSPSADDFARESIKRHQAFAEREAAATNDRERVQLFAEFIVRESRLRRGRYADAIDAMGSQILELTRDLFRRYPENQPPPSPSIRAGRSSPQASLNSVVHGAFNSTPSPGGRPESAWWSGYMPSLSPIPSMSASAAPDELSSRGRAPSRWWEASQTGSIAGERSRGVERSKRESKYMGLPLREWEDAPSTGQSTAGPSGQTLDYPPEKVGWHEQVTPRSSDPRKLDVSRLVTLPPPYPRHHPAVNNHHPDLASLRTAVRGLSDMHPISEAKQAFDNERGDGKTEQEKQRQKRLDEVRHLVDNGRMSYAEAAKVEEAERHKTAEALKAELDAFQAEVLKPLQALLSQRIVTATASFEELKAQLIEVNPVEEGDEKPELLEKLTLLKWLFEAGEQLHRELYELSSAGNERYHKVVAAPYNDQEKLREVHAFFEKDERERRVRFEKEALARLEAFMEIVEGSVTKGVEVQLSTFWDIAPPLVEVIQRVNVESGVQADAEYEFSQQYLWEVLSHAEKSAYQFIESQINLLCLLHEVKSAMTKQACKVMVAERRMAGQAPSSRAAARDQLSSSNADADNNDEGGRDDDDDDDDYMADTLRAEEERLTADLKEKVRTVEKQWHEAMGQVVEPLKARVREWLQAHGGWELCEEDD